MAALTDRKTLDDLAPIASSGRLPDAYDYRDREVARDSNEAARIDQHCRRVTDKQVKKKADKRLPRTLFGEVWNQGGLNACCACAGAALLEYRARSDRKLSSAQCSVGFLYKVTRDLIGVKGNAPTDSRTTMKALTMVGVPEESRWPTDDDLSAIDREPDILTYTLAGNYRAKTYHRLDVGDTQGEALLQEVRRKLLADLPLMFSVHFPVETTLRDYAKDTADKAKSQLRPPKDKIIAAFRASKAVRKALNLRPGLAGGAVGADATDRRRPAPAALSASATTNRIVSMIRGPRPAEQPAALPRSAEIGPRCKPEKPLTLVGHAMVACGFDDFHERLLVRNSWSKDWGEEGYGWISYDFIRKGLTEDWWLITTASFLNTQEFSDRPQPRRQKRTSNGATRPTKRRRRGNEAPRPRTAEARRA